MDVRIHMRSCMAKPSCAVAAGVKLPPLVGSNDRMGLLQVTFFLFVFKNNVKWIFLSAGIIIPLNLFSVHGLVQ